MFGFGRKGKKNEENNGLSAPYVPSSPVVMPPVESSPAPMPMPTPQPGGTPAAPGPIVFGPMSTGEMPANVTAMLSQIVTGKGPVGELLKEIKSDPEAFRARIMAQAQAAGVSTYVMPTQGTPQHVDVIDELTKAAALHDKGALTDEEFEALKKKLLG
jgi:hypothetical protein